MEAKDLEVLPFVRQLDARELDLLVGMMTERSFVPGQVIFRHGARAAGCFFVLEGMVDISTPGAPIGTPPVARLGPGSIVGEVALIDGGVRSATGHAGQEGARLAGLERETFERIFRAGNPFAYRLLDVIAERLVGKLRAATNEVEKAAATPRR